VCVCEYINVSLCGLWISDTAPVRSVLCCFLSCIMSTLLLLQFVAILGLVAFSGFWSYMINMIWHCTTWQNR